MCRLNNCHYSVSDVETQENLSSPPVRSYRRVMKPRLPRKITSAARIHLNRFWNEMEEFYERYSQRKISGNNNDLFLLPDYTTDTYDHDREAAENVANERLEAEDDDDDDEEEEEEEDLLSKVVASSELQHQQRRCHIHRLVGLERLRLQSQEILDEDEIASCSSSPEPSSSPVETIWNNLRDGEDFVRGQRCPQPPKTLLDLSAFVANCKF